MSVEAPTALEIVEAEAKAQRCDIQDVGHDDTVGITLHQLARAGSRHIFICRAQKKTFFDAGTSDSKNDALGIPYRKTPAETSLQNGRETPNKQTMAVTAFSLARRGVRVRIDTTSLGTHGLGGLSEFNDACKGDIEIIDRAGLILPFEFGGHPGFLEDVMDAVRSRAVLTPKFGRKVSGDPIRADRIPCGDATSGLRAAGTPENFNRYKLPVGYVWRQSNAKSDSEFAVEIEIPKPFLFTVNAPAFAFASAETYADIDVVEVDFTLRAIGRAYSPVGINAG